MLRNSAQKIADVTHNIIGYEVSITDKDGVIIGCSDRTRIGEFHGTSLDVIRSGHEEPADEEVARKYRVKPGICLPIKFGDRIVGSIAIAGKASEVTKYGHLVQKEAEVFLREKILLESSHLKERAMFNLVQEITSYHPEDMDESVLMTQGRGLGFDLRVPRITLIIDISRFNRLVRDLQGVPSDGQDVEVRIQAIKMGVLHAIRSVFNHPQDIISNLGTDKYIVLKALSRHVEEDETYERMRILCADLLSVLLDRGFAASIGIGRIAICPRDFQESYRSAWRAMGIGKKMNGGPGIYSIRDFDVEDLLTTLSRNKSRKFMRSMLRNLLAISNWPELRRTFMAWCDNPFHPGDVARGLNIHRNTLSYRLDKITDVSGVDIHKFSEAFGLCMAIKLYDLQGEDLTRDDLTDDQPE